MRVHSQKAAKVKRKNPKELKRNALNKRVFGGSSRCRSAKHLIWRGGIIEEHMTFSAENANEFRIGVDTGGTFTDVTELVEVRFCSWKLSSK